MEQLIELLKQIQELAGVGIDALQQASGGGEGEGGPPREERGPGGPGGPSPRGGGRPGGPPPEAEQP